LLKAALPNPTYIHAYIHIYMYISTHTYINYYNSFLSLGIKFWKVGSRKVFAAKRSDLTTKKRSICSPHDSDEEFYQESDANPKMKRSELVTEIKDMRRSIDSIASVSNSLKVPIAIRRVFIDTFSCCICHL